MSMCADVLPVCFSYKCGHINSPETDDSVRSEIHLYYDHVPSELTPIKGAMRTKWVFLTSIGQTQSEALDAYKLGMCYGDHKGTSMRTVTSRYLS